MNRAGPLVAAAAGALPAVAGVVVFALANSAGFGWTAHTGSYAPLEPGEPGPYRSRLDLTFSDGAVLWTWQHALGAGLLVLGLLVLSGVAGWWLGRRGHRAGPARPPGA